MNGAGRSGRHRDPYGFSLQKLGNGRRSRVNIDSVPSRYMLASIEEVITTRGQDESKDSGTRPAIRTLLGPCKGAGASIRRRNRHFEIFTRVLFTDVRCVEGDKRGGER